MKNSIALLDNIIKYAEALDKVQKPANKNIPQTGKSWLTHNLHLLKETIKEESNANSRPS